MTYITSMEIQVWMKRNEEMRKRRSLLYIVCIYVQSSSMQATHGGQYYHLQARISPTSRIDDQQVGEVMVEGWWWISEEGIIKVTGRNYKQLSEEGAFSVDFKPWLIAKNCSSMTVIIHSFRSFVLSNNIVAHYYTYHLHLHPSPSPSNKMIPITYQ